MSAVEAGFLVAPPGQGCRVCDLPGPVVKEINTAIWDDEVRTPAYQDRAMAVSRAAGLPVGRKAVSRHADHTEASWRRTQNPKSLIGRERTVFPVDYESVTDRAAGLSMAAMEVLEQKLDNDELEGRELVAVAKMGVAAVDSRERAKQRAEAPKHLTLDVIFGMVSGHVTVPEGQVIDVTPLSDLKAEVEQERAALRLNAGYDDTPEEDE